MFYNIEHSFKCKVCIRIWISQIWIGLSRSISQLDFASLLVDQPFNDFAAWLQRKLHQVCTLKKWTAKNWPGRFLKFWSKLGQDDSCQRVEGSNPMRAKIVFFSQGICQSSLALTYPSLINHHFLLEWGIKCVRLPVCMSVIFLFFNQWKSLGSGQTLEMETAQNQFFYSFCLLLAHDHSTKMYLDSFKFMMCD